MRPDAERARVEVEIGELVLHGFDPANRRAIAESLRAELSRLLGQPASASNLSTAAVDRLDAGVVDIPPGAAPQAIGANVAVSVARVARSGGRGEHR